MKKLKKIFIMLIMFAPIISVSAASKKVSCGNITRIPARIPELTSMVVTIIQVAVPVILIIMGMMDLFKGITAQKEDEIKKGQQTFIKRLIVAVLIFFIAVIVKFIVSIVSQVSSVSIIQCIDCFVSNKCEKMKGVSGVIGGAVQSAVEKAKDTVENAVNGD